MIATSKPAPRPLTAQEQRQFAEMMPSIRDQARFAFRQLQAEAKEEAVQEVVCSACVAFGRLVAQGRGDVATPTSLAQYAIRHVRSGRRVGCSMNVRDIGSEYCRMRKSLKLKRLDKFDGKRGRWQEVLIEDRHAGPDAVAAARIDVADWLGRLQKRDRRIAKALAVGEGTRDVARRFGLSNGRISQLRRVLHQSWAAFQGEQC